MTQQPVSFALGGGMDLVTPAVALPPGRVLAALNYEPVGSGYKRFRGFERFDGGTAPSSVASYHVLHFQNLDATPTIGDRITGNTSFGIVYVGTAPVVTSGSIGAGTAVGYIGVYLVPGTTNLSSGESFRFNNTGATHGQTTGIPLLNEAVAEAANGAWLSAAREAMRGRIAAVPGSGPVRGVWFINGTAVAVRDNAGATAGIMHYALAGWAAANLSRTFTFNSGGTFEPSVEDRLDGETSTATGIIKAITLTSGSWAAGTAAGSIVIAVSSGTFQNAENIQVTDQTPIVAPAPVYANNLTLTNTGTAYALPAGGKYFFLNHNFYGASNLSRTYGVNGVGKAFEYSGTTAVLSPITTGMTTDTPVRIAEHKNSLFLAFPGGSIQFSTVGEPLDYSPVTGAGELGIGNEVMDFATPPNSLAILGETSIHVLYGNDSSDYQLEELTDSAGALPYTAQEVGGVLYMDNRGLRSLSAAQNFGNFRMATISRLIEPLLKDKREDSIEPSASLVCRASDQYWLFFEDGTGFVAYMGGKEPSILPFNLGVTVTCAASVEDDGVERLFVGCSNGFVYELNKGTSFDGAVIEHYVRLPFNHFGSPQVDKRVHKVIADLEASGTTTLTVSAEFNYGATQGPVHETLTVTTGGGAIDSLGSNELYFASQIETVAEAYIDGVAKNVSLKIGGSTSTEEPHTLTGITYLVSPRRLVR